MSTMKIMTVRCGVCRSESKQRVLTSTNAFGAPDLDLRPPEMQRSTMSMWLAECPVCGYVAPSISEPTRVSRELLDSKEYKGTGGIFFESDLARRFYRHYLISRRSGKVKDAFYAALHAAWASDDAWDADNAREMRLLSLRELDALMKMKRGDETLLLLKCDIMRRAGLFDELIALYGETTLTEKLPNEILAFQLERARARDGARYTVSDARRDNGEA